MHQIRRFSPHTRLDHSLYIFQRALDLRTMTCWRSKAAARREDRAGGVGPPSAARPPAGPSGAPVAPMPATTKPSGDSPRLSGLADSTLPDRVAKGARGRARTSGDLIGSDRVVGDRGPGRAWPF